MGIQPPSPANTGYAGQAGYDAPASRFNAFSFIAAQLISKIGTATIAKIVAVHGGGGAISPAGTVDILPLVNQLDGQGNAIPHETIYGIPYLRWQGGATAIILDPVVGDIGIVVFASRDISKVIASGGKQANPGSYRRFDMADAMYIGGLLNGAPTRYIAFQENQTLIVDPNAIVIQTPTTTFDGDVVINGTITVT